MSVPCSSFTAARLSSQQWLKNPMLAAVMRGIGKDLEAIAQLSQMLALMETTNPCGMQQQ